MKVTSECEGCRHCYWDEFDDSGCYNPGYYCEIDGCEEEEE